jgi:cyclase
VRALYGVLLAAICTLRVCAAQTSAPSGIFTVEKLSDRVYLLSTASEGGENGEALGNVVFYVSGDGVLIVDDQFAKERRGGQTVDIAEGIVAQIKKVTDEPIRYVINTHHHADHSGGNLVFGKLATIIAQRDERQNLINSRDSILSRSPAQIQKSEADLKAARAESDNAKVATLQEQIERLRLQFDLAQSPDFEKTLPSVTYETEMQIHLGGEEIRLLHFGPAHTNGDTLVYFTKANVVHWGDVFETNSNPAIDRSGGGSTLSWIEFIDQGLKVVDPTAKMVPGHGHVGTAADVQGVKQYFTNLRDAVATEIRAGKSEDETVQAVESRFPQYKSYRPGEGRFRSNIGVIYNEEKQEKND